LPGKTKQFKTEEKYTMAAEQGLTPEQAAGYRAMMLGPLANEFKTTAKIIRAVPEACRDYRPDPNARTAWELAKHLATVDVWFLDGVADGKFGSDEEPATGFPNTIADLATWYDENVTRAMARVQNTSPEQLATPIDFMGFANLPGVMYLAFLNNHMIHHRGQLAVYLRPMGSKCPSIYGGSFDEPLKGVPQESAA
jgi:uncharacterized damage-inducible protein DinB